MQSLYALQEIGTVTSNDQGLGLTSGSKGDIQVVSANDWFIKDDAVESNMLNTNSVTSDAIAPNSVGASELADDAVDTNAIVGNSVTGSKLANNIGLSTFVNDTGYITPSAIPAVFVTGMIMMYTGTSAPSGWALCDGHNGTPDLGDKFIVGAGGGYSVGDTGGANSVQLTIDQIPSHDHSYVGHTYPGSGPEQNQSGGVEDRTSFNVNKTSGTRGGGQYHENRPPYYALCFIMKL